MTVPAACGDMTGYAASPWPMGGFCPTRPNQTSAPPLASPHILWRYDYGPANGQEFVSGPALTSDGTVLAAGGYTPDGGGIAYALFAVKNKVEQWRAPLPLGVAGTPTVGVTPSDFVLALLRSWETTHVVNGVSLEARPNIDSAVITPWLNASGGATLDLAKAPFKLLAITNRLDLHSPDCSSAGEGRFVFGVTTQSGGALPFTMIFEYHLPTTATVTPHVWAQRWHKLHNFDILSVDTAPDDAGAAPDSYNEQLQAITDRFATRGALAGAPNGNAISQVRTNEIALSSPWQLREFHLLADASGKGFLVPGTTAQSPTQAGLNNTPTLHDFIADNKAAINGGSIKMPLTYTDTINGVTNTVSILGPESNEDGARWQSPDPTTARNPAPIDVTTLTNFSFLTCNGCHNLQNVQIGGFYHVDPLVTLNPDGGATEGSARLSPFLLGTTSPPVPSDLARRAKVMQGLLCSSSCPLTPLVSGPEAARVH